MGSTFNGLIGLIILALDIWAIINVLKSGAETGMKILWVLLIIFLPVLGLVIWAIAGPRGNVRFEPAVSDLPHKKMRQFRVFVRLKVRPVIFPEVECAPFLGN